MGYKSLYNTQNQRKFRKVFRQIKLTPKQSVFHIGIATISTQDVV